MNSRRETSAVRRHEPARHMTVAERAASGRRARGEVSRSALAAWEPADHRDALGLLASQARTRIPELVAARYERMAASPFAYFRGASAVMAADLASAPSTGLRVQLCGDAHLVNFGVFAAPDRRLVFSVNDFDETLPGPFEWDVKRLCASLAVVGRERRLDSARRARIVRVAAATYRSAMQEFAAMGSTAIWYARLDVRELNSRWGPVPGTHEARVLEQIASCARTRDHVRAMTRLTEVGGGRRRFLHRPPLLVRLAELIGDQHANAVLGDVDGLLGDYLSTLPADRRVLLGRFRVVDVARKVVGVGSVGTRDWVLLLLGRDDNDPLLLQFKEAEPSVLERYLGPSNHDHHGRRVVEGQRLMQAASDVLLGWQRTAVLDGTSRDYYVRQLWDNKGGADVDHLSRHSLALYGSCCAWTLARAHARSGDPIAISTYLGAGATFDKVMVDFAERYATQNASDHADLLDAITTGAVTVAPAG